MNAAFLHRGTSADARDRRRAILLTLGGLLVAVYILAPFCWLLLTSFMHEQDALSVPPQWIPMDMDFSNYATVFDKIPFWRRVGQKVHEYDCRFIMQLSHSGRQRDIPGIENLMNKSLSSTNTKDGFVQAIDNAASLSNA